MKPRRRYHSKPRRGNSGSPRAGQMSSRGVRLPPSTVAAVPALEPRPRRPKAHRPLRYLQVNTHPAIVQDFVPCQHTELPTERRLPRKYCNLLPAIVETSSNPLRSTNSRPKSRTRIHFDVDRVDRHGVILRNWSCVAVRYPAGPANYQPRRRSRRLPAHASAAEAFNGSRRESFSNGGNSKNTDSKDRGCRNHLAVAVVSFRTVCNWASSGCPAASGSM